MDTKMQILFWDLFNAEDENVLHEIVLSNELMATAENWFPYGGNSIEDRSNFSTFENQQPEPIPALVEKITNSIDSLLLKECRLSGVNPKSSEAPKTLKEAVEKYFKIKNGDFSEIAIGARREIAENIQVIATGDREKPNLLIYDNGEGQDPKDFPNTFLSLRSRNKTDIHFVQGKYNMGSTGAVVFCGRHRYQLIASKLTKGLSTVSSNEFGFTLVRQHPFTKEELESGFFIPWYEYFRVNGIVPSFPIEKIDVGLWEDKPFVTGSLVKLYSYQLPRGSKSDITLDLWRDLNQYLYSPALPIMLYEKRFTKGKSPSKLMLGNKTRIIIDERDKKEKTIPISITTEELGRVEIEATVFRPDVQEKEFIKDKAVNFSLNGQVHRALSRRFISYDLKFSMLRDSLLINVDCTNMRNAARLDLFMANRYNMKEGELYERFIDKLIQVIGSNESLIEINQLRKSQLMREKSGDKEILTSIINSIPLDKTLLDLLNKGGNLNFLTKKPSNGVKNKRKENEIKLPKKRFPSIFRIDLPEGKDGKRVKSIPINGSGQVTFETDVEDEYLFRPKDRGELSLEILDVTGNSGGGGGGRGKPKKIADVFEVTRSGPTNATIKFVLHPKNNVRIGEEMKLDARLSSPSGALESIFYIQILDPKKPPKETVKPKPEDRPDIPKPIPVFKQKQNADEMDWNDMGWENGDNIVKIILSDKDSKKIDAIAINMDSYPLINYLSRNRINQEKRIKYVKDKYFAEIYLHSLMLYGIFANVKGLDETQASWDTLEMVPKLFRLYSQFLLSSGLDEAILKSLEED